jgi:hypothetical protein
LAGFLLTGCLHLPPGTTPKEARIVANIEFTSATFTGPVPKTELATWWNTKLKIGSEDPDAYEFLTISTNGKQTKVKVQTCAEYTNAILQGSYSLTTADMAMDSWFFRAAGILRFMEKAHLSRRPLSSDFLTRVPVSILDWNGSDEEAQINADTRKGMTLNDYAYRSIFVRTHWLGWFNHKSCSVSRGTPLARTRRTHEPMQPN